MNDTTTVLDVGGSLFFWELARKLGFPVPKVTVINLEPPPKNLPTKIQWEVGDGTQLAFNDYTFDIAFSNSVIEHVGDKEMQRTFAREVQRAGKQYFVQTPNHYFPVEPHLITPFIHWLPKSLQKRLIRRFTIWGLVTHPSQEECERFLKEVRLLTRREMKEFFPSGEIIVERFLGLPKSIIAIGTTARPDAL